MKNFTNLFLLVFLILTCFVGCGEVRNSNEIPVDVEIETAPSLAEVTSVSDPGNDTSPNYTFSSTEVGTISYGGSCSAGITSSVIGSNTITLNALSEGTYSDCTIIVTDPFGNVSDTLTLTTFEIDTTSPTVSEVTTVTHPTNDTTPNYTFSSNEAGTISFGGSCSSSSTSATSGNNTIALKGASSSTLAEGTYSDCTITVTDEAGNVSSSITITEFDVDLTASTIAEVTAVETPTNDTTPNYSFSSTQNGDLAYGGSCSSDNTTAEASDNNTITLKGASTSTLAEGTYSDCTITLSDNASNPVTLNISSFVIDTTAPTLNSTSPADLDNLTSLSGSITVTFSEEMDNISSNSSGTSCSGALQLSSNNFSTCLQSSSSPTSSDNITFTLDPSDNLSFYTTYKIKVTTSATDLAGNNLASDNTTSNGFTTKYFTTFLGTSSGEEGRGIDSDSDNYTYITGGTYGGLNSNTNSGDQDIFLVKMDNETVTHWTVQLGSSSNDSGRGVAVDTSSNIYVTGYTEGGLNGYTNLGEEDIFLLKYNSSGTIQWTRQLGTSESDIAHGVAVNSNYIYVVGETEGGLDNNTNSGDKDIFLVQYNASGTRLWTQQLGTTSDDVAYGVEVDSSNNAYVTGKTYGGLDNNSNFGSADIFLAKYNSSGVLQWANQYGTSSEDVAYAITHRSSNVYLTGYTKGNLNSESNSHTGSADVFIINDYDNSTYRNTVLLGGGTNNAEKGRSISVDSSNNVYVTGDNNTTNGDYDAFLAKFNSSLSAQWTDNITSDNTTGSYADYGYGVMVNSDGYIYVVGNTGGEIDNNTNSGEQDVFIFKYDTSGTRQ